METSLRIALVQCNSILGDWKHNQALIEHHYAQACLNKADLVVFPELCLCGYPPEDFLLRPEWAHRNFKALQAIQALTKNQPTALLLGSLWHETDALYNSALLLEKGKITHLQHKMHLPNYGVFDEKRVFTPGPTPPHSFEFRGHRIGILICEDLWHADTVHQLFTTDVDLILSINASPYETGKHEIRKTLARSVIETHATPLIYVNLVGGQDELVFDGRSFALDANGETVTELGLGKEEWALLTYESRILTHTPLLANPPRTPRTALERRKTTLPSLTPKSENNTKESEHYQLLCLSLQDYVEKNQFPGVILGLSGGIDSALTATLAVDALGKERVQLVLLPSRYTSEESTKDAEALANNLSMPLQTLSIEPLFETSLQTLGKALNPQSTAPENLQARIRGLLLMALSNSNGALLLTTGNKSELSVGYATLYGDMCGGFNLLKDLYKTEVFALARWRNQCSSIFPERILTKAPTAELKHNQTDQDTLPPYELLDSILFQIIEQRKSTLDLIAQGFEPTLVHRIERMLRSSEYKRRQSAPGTKLSTLAFGRDHRYPITYRMEN